MGVLRTLTITIEIPVTTSNGAAYSNFDQIGSLITVDPFFHNTKGAATFLGVTLVDKAKQNAALALLLFDQEPTITSSDNDPFTITDAELADKCCGVINFPFANYYSLANNSVCTNANLLDTFKSATTGSRKLWMVLISAGTPTYTSTSDLYIRLHLGQAA